MKRLEFVCFLLLLPVAGRTGPPMPPRQDHHLILVDSNAKPSDKLADAKNKLRELVRERQGFNPFRHKGDLAIVISAIGVVIGGLKLWVELRKRKKPQPPPQG